MPTLSAKNTCERAAAMRSATAAESGTHCTYCVAIHIDGRHFTVIGNGAKP